MSLAGTWSWAHGFSELKANRKAGQLETTSVDILFGNYFSLEKLADLGTSRFIVGQAVNAAMDFKANVHWIACVAPCFPGIRAGLAHSRRGSCAGRSSCILLGSAAAGA